MDAPAAHSGADDEDDDDQSDDMGAELRLVPADAELGVYSLRWGGGGRAAALCACACATLQTILTHTLTDSSCVVITTSFYLRTART